MAVKFMIFLFFSLFLDHKKTNNKSARKTQNFISHFSPVYFVFRKNEQTFVYITDIKCLIINHINVQRVVYIKHRIFIRIK